MYCRLHSEREQYATYPLKKIPATLSKVYSGRILHPPGIFFICMGGWQVGCTSNRNVCVNGRRKNKEQLSKELRVTESRYYLLFLYEITSIYIGHVGGDTAVLREGHFRAVCRSDRHIEHRLGAFWGSRCCSTTSSRVGGDAALLANS